MKRFRQLQYKDHLPVATNEILNDTKFLQHFLCKHPFNSAICLTFNYLPPLSIIKHAMTNIHTRFMKSPTSKLGTFE